MPVFIYKLNAAYVEFDDQGTGFPPYFDNDPYIHTFERPIIHEQAIMDDTHEQSDCKYEALNRKFCCSAFSTKQPPRTSASADQHRLHCGVNFCMGKNLVQSYHAVQAIFYLPVCKTDRFETPGLTYTLVYV